MAKRTKRTKHVATRELVDLTPDELTLLRNAPYAQPVVVRGRWKRVADSLMRIGLLERDPSARFLVVRQTLTGAEQARPVSQREAAHVSARIAKLDRTMSSLDMTASAVEHALWYRILVESQLGFVNNAILRAATAHVE